MSDGAGSAPRADVGSALAVSTASTFLRALLPCPTLPWPDALAAAARSAQGALLAQAASHSAPLHAYACTLLLLVITPNGGGALQIGDGVMATREAQQPWRYVFWPQKGEFVNTTHFLTDVDAEQTWEVAAVDTHVCDAAAMTDGLETLALQFASRAVHAGFFDGVIRPLLATGKAGEATEVSASLDTFLRSPRVLSRTDDDLTLVVASRSDPT